MAEQKSEPAAAAKSQRGNKKKRDGGEAPKARSGGKRRSAAYYGRGHDARNAARRRARQRRREDRADRPDRTPKGAARAMRRAHVKEVTGAERGLAVAERNLYGTEVPDAQQRLQKAVEDLADAIFGVRADGTQVPRDPDPISQIFDEIDHQA